MRKLLIPLIITFLLMISNNTFAQFGGGSGTSASPWHIITKAHLITLSNNVNGGNSYSGKFFIMDNDINMSVAGTFNPIGNSSSRSFQGNFNGNGKKITNLTISTTNNYVGLFGNILNSTIENIGIDNTCSFNSLSNGGTLCYVGALVAYSNNSNFNKCYSLATTTAANQTLWCAGGLIGYSIRDTINNCYARAKILCNNVWNFSNCYNGGLIGQIGNTTTFYLSNSYSAPISMPTVGPWPASYGTGNVGALIGNQFATDTNHIKNTYYLQVEYLSGDQWFDFATSHMGIQKYLGEMRIEQFAIDLNACQTNTWRWANRDTTLNNGMPMLDWQGIGVPIGCTVSEGISTNPFRIRCAKDLITLSNDVASGATYPNSYFIVENDINFHISGYPDSSSLFNPIGNTRFSFQGNFNGNGHKITNLTISEPNFVGLFGKILNATIEKLGIDSTCSFTCPGGYGGTLYYGGALVAYSTKSRIKNSYSIAKLVVNGGSWSFGGLIGGSEKDTINNCYARAKILGAFDWSPYYGGLIGQVMSTDIFYLSNSYSAPVSLPVNNSTNSGSLIGHVNGSISNVHVVNSYYLNITGALNYVGISKSLGDMRTEQFAVDLNACQTNTWRWANRNTTLNNGLPMLDWQGIGDTIGCTVSVGISTNPFRIRYAKDLITLSNDVASGATYPDSYFIVENDISFKTGSIDSSSLFNPIGRVVEFEYGNVTTFYSFQGHFNGNGHKISNLKLLTANNYLGLFGYILNAKIDSIGIDSTCSFTCTAHSNNTYYGGALAGYSKNSTIENSFTTATINITGGDLWSIGGLIGGSDRDTINNCYARANILRPISGGAAWTNIYGGLIGSIINTNNYRLSNSYSAPVSLPVANADNRRSLIGNVGSSNIHVVNSYYLQIATNTGGEAGTQKLLSDMRTQQFAIDLNVSCQNHNWKYDNGSPLINNGLPILYWQVGGTTIPPCFDGNGIEDDPFRIRYVKDLVKLSNSVAGGSTFSDTYFVVENDINFHIFSQTDSSVWFNPIGNNTNSFQGNFSGGGHKISNLTINTGNYVGLFGYISGATIDSLGIENFTLTSSNYCGGLVAYATNASTIKNSFSLALLTGSWNGMYIYMGGLIGYSNNCTINNCYSISTINCSYSTYLSEYNYNGGLIGDIENGSISNSYSAPISITYGDFGGLLVGYNNSSVDFTTSYCLDIAISGHNIPNNYGIKKGSNEMRSGCFVATLNNSQNPIAWFKAKSQVNLGYPVLSLQKLSDGITTAGFEGSCLSVTTFDGGQTVPYKVKYVKDLIYISNMVANDTTYSSKYFQMLNDINYNNGAIDSSSLYNPIGNFSNNKQFSGNFSGERYAIANYSFSDATKDNIGLFGYIKGATIKKLGISNISIKAGNNVGGLVGNTNANSKLDSCFVYGYINGVNNVGGLVGMVTTGSCDILRSFANTTIDAQTNVGGLVGNHNGGPISDSYSNSEIYSSTSGNNYVGGIIGNASSASSLINVYSACKIIRNGTNTNFGKIKGNNLGSNTNCYSRDSVFVNCSNGIGYNGNPMTNAGLRNTSFVTTLGSTWMVDYADNINDGYPILKYQLSPIKLNTSGFWHTTGNWVGSVFPKASQVVIIPNGKQIKINNVSAPMAAYIKIENGGTLLNGIDMNFFGEYQRELYVGKWNLIGLSTYNKILSCIYNYTDSISFKTFVKTFNTTTNNWDTNTVKNINTQFNYCQGFLVMPNYSLDSRLLTKSKIISKGVLYNNASLSYYFTNTAAGRFVPFANNYPANLTAASFLTTNTSLIQGGLIYVYDADSGKWNNNINTNVRVSFINPGEGFFVAASAASGSLSFTKLQLNTSTKNIIKSDLIYVKAFANNQERESFLEFNDDADNGFDFNDGLMLFGYNYYSVEPFFRIPTQQINDSTTQLIKDAFSSLPYSTELDLRSQDNNDVSLEFSNIPSGIYVYLIDSLLSKVQCLNENPYYNIKVSEGNNGNRLTVLFTYNKSDAKGFFNNNSNEEIRIWNHSKDLNIEGKDLVKYEIYDVMGNKLLEQGIPTNKFQTLLNLNTGVYIVRAISKTGLKTQKISIVSE